MVPKASEIANVLTLLVKAVKGILAPSDVSTLHVDVVSTDAVTEPFITNFKSGLKRIRLSLIDVATPFSS